MQHKRLKQYNRLLQKVAEITWKKGKYDIKKMRPLIRTVENKPKAKDFNRLYKMLK